MHRQRREPVATERCEQLGARERVLVELAARGGERAVLSANPSGPEPADTVDDPLRPRSGQWYGPEPHTGAEAHALVDMELTRLLRIWLANRGIWEALPGAGPTCPVPTTDADVDRYVDAYAELLSTLTA